MDERNNRPSCSYLERIALCPGSWQLSQQIPKADPESLAEGSPDAASGTRIHAFLAGELPAAALSEEELHTAESCDSKLGDILVQLEVPKDAIVHKERRYWFGQLFSGKADVVFEWVNKAEERCALIADYKTGRGDTTTAEGNIQLRGLVACVSEETLGLQRIYAAIVAPWQGKSISLVEYRDRDIDRAALESTRIVTEAEKPGAPLYPSPKACRYCPAKGICPALQDTTKDLQTIAPPGLAVTKDDIHAAVVALTSNDLLILMAHNDIREMANAAVRGEIRRRIMTGDPEVSAVWRITEGTRREKIVDVNKVFSRLSAMGVQAQEFAGICSVTKKALTELVKTAVGGKGKELEAKLKSITEGATEFSMSAGELEKIETQ